MGLLELYHARYGGLATGSLYAIARLQRVSSTELALLARDAPLVDPSSGFHVFLWAVGGGRTVAGRRAPGTGGTASAAAA